MMVILLAALIGFFIGLPQILAMRALGDGYAGISFLYQDSEDVYLSRIREVVEGHNVSSPMLYEYKAASPIQLATGEYFYGWLTNLSGLPLETIVFWSKFILPALLFLVIYYLVYLLLERTPASRLTALATGALLVAGDGLASPQLFSRVGLSIWSRLVNPITGAILLFLLFLLCWQLFKQKSSIFSVLAGLTLALMTGYIFSFGIAAAFVGLALIFFLIKKQWSLAGKFLLIILIAMALNWSYLWGILQTQITDQSSLLKNGLLYTHLPVTNKYLLISFIVLIMTAFFVRNEIWLFTFGMNLAALFALNQQIITGLTIWPGHFQQYIIPIVIFSLMIILHLLLRPVTPKFWTPLCLSLILISLVFANRQAQSYQLFLADFVDRQRSAPVFQWLKDAADKNCVVVVAEAEERITRSVTAFTPCDVYYSHYTFFGIPQERIKHNYLVWLKLQDVQPEQVEQFIREHADSLRFVMFRDWRDLFRHTSYPWLGKISDRVETDRWLNNLILAMAADYKEFSKKDFGGELKKYKVDYLIRDIARQSAFPAEKYPFLKPAATFNRIEIYEIKS